MPTPAAPSTLIPEEGVFPLGPFTAWATPDGSLAQVRQGETVIKRYRGEVAYQNAVRDAGDRNALANRR